MLERHGPQTRSEGVDSGWAGDFEVIKAQRSDFWKRTGTKSDSGMIGREGKVDGCGREAQKARQIRE